MLEGVSILVLLLILNVQPLAGEQCWNSLEAREKENTPGRNTFMVTVLPIEFREPLEAMGKEITE